jgi:hypothetical protein
MQRNQILLLHRILKSVPYLRQLEQVSGAARWATMRY